MEIRWNGSILFYEKAGNGARILLLFHGFGQNHGSLKSFATYNSGDFTCYFFDLFFHGKSIWNHDDKALSHDEWSEFLQQFLHQEKIERFSVAGFSIGARLALSAARSFAHRMDHLILMAPDGPTQHPLYRLATHQPFVRRIFRHTLKNPGFLLFLLDAAKRLRLAEDSTLATARFAIASPETRSMLYHTWMVFRMLNVDMKTLASILNAENVNVCLYLSSKDRMIRERPLKKFTALLKRVTAHTLTIPHHKLPDAVARRLGTDLRVRNENRY